MTQVTDDSVADASPVSSPANAPARDAPCDVTVVGGGILGLWQAVTLAQAGHRVRLLERSPPDRPFAGAASRYAGAMLAPDTEAEAAPTVVRDLGRIARDVWAAHVAVTGAGSLVVASPRAPGDLKRFARATERHVTLDGAGLAALEPELAGRFSGGLYFAHEAHVAAETALAALRTAARAAGAEIVAGVAADVDDAGGPGEGWTIDCRGLAARRDVPRLRGVRGERALVRARDVGLGRPVRLLDPRVPLYVVPWADHVFMVGATVIESEDDGPMTVRSALELLGTACQVHPGFAEAEILDLGAGVRPALPDNVPRATVAAPRRLIRVNGAYRHGFLLAPMLAAAVRDHLAGRAGGPLLVP
jgi:glycine oxidase